MTRKPFKPTESVFSRGIGYEIIWIGILMGIVSLAVGYVYWSIDPNGVWQTMVFTTLTLSQMGNAMAIRSNRESLFSIGIFSNMMMIWAVLLTFVLQLAVIYVPFLQQVFGTEALGARDLAISLAASAVVFVIIEIYKWARRRWSTKPE